jgi:uncharacterized membrane protein (DUF4010 family)
MHPDTATAATLAEALLIGFLVGAQREASQGEGHPGVRDFVLICLVGAVCGLLQNTWLAAAALLSVSGLLAVFYLRGRERTGITTELAAVTVFALGFLTATPMNRLALAAAVAVVAFLEFKRSLHRLLRETITEAEFDDTVWFLAVIFIVYPLLPEGRFGPYEFLAPREIWTFVILVSSVSYAGYFLQKFLGARRGLKLAGLFGGLASTTAATASFAKNSRQDPDNQVWLAQAAMLANAMQFPRLLVIIEVVSPPLAAALWKPMAAMTAVGLAAAFLFTRGRPATPAPGPPAVSVRNPFRLWPALQFGALFGAILLASRAAAAAFGSGGVYWTSAFGGALDVDAVSLSLADLLTRGTVAEPSRAAGGVLLALLANAVLKTGLAYTAGTPAFARRVAANFAAMLLAGGALWRM